MALVPTWLHNVTSSAQNLARGAHYAMPFSVNNVDASVAANTVYGLTAAVIVALHTNSGPSPALPDWFDADVQQIYTDTARLIAYAIEEQWVLTRTDIVLLYYPSVYDFYWFVARTVLALESEDLNSPALAPLQAVWKVLSGAMRGAGTAQLLDMAKSVSGEAGVEYTVWDDFLGNNDTTAYVCCAVAFSLCVCFCLCLLFVWWCAELHGVRWM